MLKKSYMKASRRRDGFIEKPFEKLTDELINQYSEKSRIEVENIVLMLDASPHLFEADNELSIWNSISTDLSLFQISNDLSKMHNYRGGLLSLKYYLVVRAGVEDNPQMFATALLLNVALDKTYCLFHNDIDALARVVDSAYYNGEVTSLASFQREVVAGQSRTGEATKAVIDYKEKRIEKARVKATELRIKYPGISKNEIARLICDDLGVAFWTARNYLNNMELPD